MKKILLLVCIWAINIFPQVNYDTVSVNNIHLVIHKDGNLRYGSYLNNPALWSAGFYLSAYSNGQLYAAGMFDTGQVYDFIAGKVGSNSNDPLNKLYVVKKEDGDFAESWNVWANAVQNGARFYDGDGDGIYNPVDLNNNGQWDPNEDKPELIGDYTAFTVFHDTSWNFFYDVNPQGIEIRQTTFAFSSDEEYLNNVLFFRYEILNTGVVTEVLDSVLFGFAADTDNGTYSNDLMGSDTNLLVGFVYDKLNDLIWGDNAPAQIIDVLQTPHEYIPGETFEDLNGNGIYDDGDIPLDTAFYKQDILGEKIIDGAKNVGVNVVTWSIQLHPTWGILKSKSAVRFRLLGKNSSGEWMNTCDTLLSNGGDLDSCWTIDPRFIFSGNPVDSTGWLQTHPAEIRVIVPTAPFTLRANKPVEIIVAYIVGRGENSLNSLDVAREYDLAVKEFYSRNFDTQYVGVENENGTEIPEKFMLYQNYPNPFNPTTTIEYSIPDYSAYSKVQLKIYDVLGREIATLVNEKQSPGNYSVKFDASNLPSGIYFYRIIAGKYIATKKMILMK